MKRKIGIGFILFAFFTLNLVGCASLRKKFVRKKKKPQRLRPVVRLEDYRSEISFDELYQKHFLFWKYWELELINCLHSDNQKKQILCSRQSIDNLKKLQSYLVLEKAELLSPHIEKMEKIDKKIKKGFLTKLERYRVKLELEKIKRGIEREFPYRKIKEFLKKKEEIIQENDY